MVSPDPSLYGEPYIEESWRVNGDGGRRLTLRYRLPGYEAPTWKTMGERDEFAGLDLHEDGDGWFLSLALEVDEGFRRRGYARELMRRGVELVKKAGGRGVKSNRGFRTRDADSFWRSLGAWSDGDFDYMEGVSFREWLGVDGGGVSFGHPMLGPILTVALSREYGGLFGSLPAGLEGVSGRLRSGGGLYLSAAEAVALGCFLSSLAGGRVGGLPAGLAGGLSRHAAGVLAALGDAVGGPGLWRG